MPFDPTLIENGGAAPDRPPADKAIERTLIETRTKGGADERTLLEGRPPPTPGGGVGLNLVPGAQFLEYRLVEPIRVASGEAELWVADGGGRRVVLKFYRWGLHPKAGLSEKLSRISKGHIVEVYGRGTSPDGRDYEILEFIRYGTLADFGKGGLPEPKVREVLRELTDAVTALHAENILHRDLKPANVLVRTIVPLQIVLTDFGISSVMDISLHVTTVSRTAAYSAPEAMTGVLSKASDWWSVGVIVMELLQGTQPFAGLDERAINFALVMRGITVPKEIPPEWQSLLKGLLTRDHAKRWNELQIGQWFDGKTNIPVYYNEANAAPVVRIRKNRPCQFLKTDYFEPAELALAMAQQWDEAAKRLERGIISDWIKKEVQNADLASLLIDIQEDSSLNADQKLAVSLPAMNSQLPLSWRGEVVNQDWMATHPAIAVEFLKSGLSTWLKKIRQDAWLEELKERYFALRYKINNTCDDETILKAALATDAALLESGRTAQRNYYSSTDSQLSKLLSKRQLTPVESAILALAPPTCFVTRWTAAKEHVTEFAGNITVCGGCIQALIQFPTTKSALNSRIAELHEEIGKLEKELECILGGGAVPSLLQPAVTLITDLQAGFDSLLAERLSAENEVANVLPHQLQPDRFDRITKRLNKIEKRFSDIDCSQLREFIRNAQRINAETIILNELPQQLGAGQLRTTKQRLQDIKSQFPYINCAAIEKSIGEWEAFYHDLSSEMDRLEHDVESGFWNAKGWDLLYERLDQFGRDFDQRERQLNDDYKDTEFGKMGLEEMATLRRRWNGASAKVAQIKHERQRPIKRKRQLLGVLVFAIVIAIIGMVLWNKHSAHAKAKAEAAAEAEAAAAYQANAARSARDEAEAAAAAEATAVAATKAKAVAAAKANAEAEAERRQIAADAEAASNKRLEWTGAGMRRTGYSEEQIRRTLTQGGTVVAWGANEKHQCDVPKGLSNVVSIAAGGAVSLALKQDGTVVQWGSDDFASAPVGLRGVVAIAAGGEYCMALKYNGKVEAWRRKVEAWQSSISLSEMSPLEALSNVVAIDVGTDGAVALKNNGTVAVFRDGGLREIVSLTNVVSIAAGKEYATFVALMRNGQVALCSGDRMLGYSYETTMLQNVNNAVAIALASREMVVWTRQGKVGVWESNYSPPETKVPPKLSNVIALSVKSNNFVALKRDGTVVAWVLEDSWPSLIFHESHVPIGLSNVVAVAAGMDGHTLALKLE